MKLISSTGKLGSTTGGDATTGSGALRGVADAGASLTIGSVDATGRSWLRVIIDTRLATKHKPASVAMAIKTFPNTVINRSTGRARAFADQVALISRSVQDRSVIRGWPHISPFSYHASTIMIGPGPTSARFIIGSTRTRKVKSAVRSLRTSATSSTLNPVAAAIWQCS